MQRLGKYVVYDPPDADLPYLAVLFMPGDTPRVFVFDTYGQAVRFLTDDAVAHCERAATSRDHLESGPAALLRKIAAFVVDGREAADEERQRR